MASSIPASLYKFPLPLAFKFEIPTVLPGARWNFRIDAENILHAFPANSVEGFNARNNGSSTSDDHSHNDSDASTPSINKDTTTSSSDEALPPSTFADETANPYHVGRLYHSMLDDSVTPQNTNTIISFMDTPNQIAAHVKMHAMSTQPGHCNKLNAFKNASVWHFIERSNERRQAQSRKLLGNRLQEFIFDLPNDIVSTLRGQNQDEIYIPQISPTKSPMTGSLSWASLFRDVAANVSKQNAPIPDDNGWDDCWLHPVDDTEPSGYPTRWLSPDGIRNQVGLHKILYRLVNGDVPNGHELVPLYHRVHVTSIPESSNCTHAPFLDSSHRTEPCHEERAAPEDGVKWACINPTHYSTMASGEVYSRGYCCLAMRISCPHQPSCLWTGPEGQRLRCWDKQKISTCPHGIIMCRCKNQCFTCRNPRPIVRTRAKVELKSLEELFD